MDSLIMQLYREQATDEERNFRSRKEENRRGWRVQIMSMYAEEGTMVRFPLPEISFKIWQARLPSSLRPLKEGRATDFIATETLD